MGQLLTERDVELLRLELIENVLTLKCPGCKIAFFDFDGCHNVTCHKCQLDFCAMCLNSCTQAHQHLTDNFKDHHIKRQRDIIKEKLTRLPEKTAHTLLRIIKKELDDLGINVFS